MTSIGLRPALLFLSSAGVNTTASISPRKLSNGTTRSIISSGSPFAEIAASRLSASKNPSCPIGPTSANRVVISQTRINWLRRLFFEVPYNLRKRKTFGDFVELRAYTRRYLAELQPDLE